MSIEHTMRFRPGSGALRASAMNPRYFTDDSGRTLYLAGTQTWASLQERRGPETPLFDYERWLNFIESHGMNYLRMWTWEHARGMQFSPEPVDYSPNWYRRSGPGTALDGHPRFDLDLFDEYLFHRLRDRVVRAGERGLYVAIMLFQGFSVDKRQGALSNNTGMNAYLGHPMHRENNVNGIDGDPDGSGTGHQVHTLDVARITRLQERFVAKIIDTVGDLENVLWEISNETHRGSVAWQYHLIDFIRRYERERPLRHPVGMSGAPIPTADLLASDADWISPHSDGRRQGIEPPEMDGSKVVIADTDHIGALVSSPSFVWRSMFRGHHFCIMDPYMDVRYGSPRAPHTEWEELRRQTGFSVRLAERCGLEHLAPAADLASTGYCLAAPDREYVAFLNREESVEIDLSGATGRFESEWLDTETGTFVAGEPVAAGASSKLVPTREEYRVVRLFRPPT